MTRDLRHYNIARGMNSTVGWVRRTYRKRDRQVTDAVSSYRTLIGTGEVGDATFHWCVAELKSLSILPIGNLPAGKSQHVSYDLNRQHRREDQATVECLAKLRAIRHDRIEKFEEAKNVRHPLANPARTDLSRDMRIVCEHIGEKREATPAWRRVQLGRFKHVSSLLQPMSARMRRRQPLHVKLISGGVHVALIACIGEARGYSDFTLALRYVTGFGIIGLVEKTGLWREKSADEMRIEMSDKSPLV